MRLERFPIDLDRLSEKARDAIRRGLETQPVVVLYKNSDRGPIPVIVSSPDGGGMLRAFILIEEEKDEPHERR